MAFPQEPANLPGREKTYKCIYLCSLILLLSVLVNPSHSATDTKCCFLSANSYLELSEGESSSAAAAKGGSWSLSSLLNLRLQRLLLSSFPSRYNYMGCDIKSDKNPRAGLVVYSTPPDSASLVRALPASHAFMVKAGGRSLSPVPAGICLLLPGVCSPA